MKRFHKQSYSTVCMLQAVSEVSEKLLQKQISTYIEDVTFLYRSRKNFNHLMPGGNKRSYIRKQTCS